MTQIAARLPTSDYASIDRVAWAVTTASRYVPRATCLTQALAAQLLLTRHGLPFSLYVGVAKDQREKLVAHAWVESQGKIVIGGSGLGQYTPLLVLKGEHLWVQSPRSTR